MDKTPLNLGRQLSSLKNGSFVTLQKIMPSGSIQARKQSNGAITFYWRYTIRTETDRVILGLYDPSAPPKTLMKTGNGYSIAAAVRAAEQLAIKHHENKSIGGHPAVEAAKRKNLEIAEKEVEEAKKYTLANLLNDYVNHLEAQGRVSYREARSTFKVHVLTPHPKIALQPASQVTTEQIADMMRRTNELKKGRTANKLRSYLSAAFQTAKTVRSNPKIPEHFKGYEISFNPAQDTVPDRSENRPDKNPLTTIEMKIYWKNIKSLTGIQGAILRLHLLTGGQRIQQLVMLKTKDISSSSIQLIDTKGRPGRDPRKHKVPLIQEAILALMECKPTGLYALSSDGGKTHISATTLSKWAISASNGIDNFLAKRIRSGVETLLSIEGVSKEVRGHLQSHGISGIQSTHYDGNDFLKEITQALELLFLKLDTE